MQFYFWAVREGSESDPNSPLTDTGLHSLNALIKPIWTESFESHDDFVARAVQLLSQGFSPVVSHPATRWYGQEHQPSCDLEGVCISHTAITLVDDPEQMPIRAQVDSKVILRAV